MKVQVQPILEGFKPFWLQIKFEEERDLDLFNSMLKKIGCEIKPGGLYHDILRKIGEALAEIKQ